MTVDYLDRGKTRLKVTDEIAGEIGKALKSITKETYKAEKRRRRSRGGGSYYVPVYSGPTIKDAVFEFLPEAIQKSTQGGTYRVGARDLYYAIRPLVLPELQEDGKALEYGYFSQTLIVQYEEEFGPIQGLYRDPRGILYEPHSEVEVPLGTIGVAGYEFPAWHYNKILYIEKKGIAQQLKPSKLAQRWDIAIIAGEGYASEACRILLDRADRSQQYTIYVLHDADPYGYNIANTLREETVRMPFHDIFVEDLGLTVADAIEMDLQTETFYRKNTIPYRVRKGLTQEETEWFRPNMKKCSCTRVELNAIPVPERADFIEQKLIALEIEKKVIPDEKSLPDLVKDIYIEKSDSVVDQIIEDIISIDDIKKQIRDDFESEMSLEDALKWIKVGFKKDDSQWWEQVVKKKVSTLISKIRHKMKESTHNEILANIEKSK